MTAVPLFPFAEYWWLYACFTVFVLGMLALDLGGSPTPLYYKDQPTGRAK